jgi:hypothetical protein
VFKLALLFLLEQCMLYSSAIIVAPYLLYVIQSDE